MLTCRSFACCLLVLAAPLSAEESALIGTDSGALAIREKADEPWALRRTGDSVPAAFEFRATPGRRVRLEMPGGTLQFAAETTGRWDGEQRRLSISRGQALVQLAENATPLQLVSDGPENGWQLAVGTEVVWQRAENEQWHVLNGSMKSTLDAARAFAAPATVQRNPDGTVESSIPEKADDWSAKLLRWTKSSQGMGQLISKDSQDGSPVRLDIARYRVNVVIQPPVALVQIDQSFYNPYHWQQEGTFVFNLPPGASVSRFAMFVTPHQLIEGELINRKEADRIYTTIVRGRRDPAILEQIGDNLFRMRVFPIFAEDTKRILLDYTIPLTSDNGQYRFELPLLSDLKPIWDFTLNGTIYPPVDAAQVTSFTHPNLKFDRSPDGRVTFGLSERMVRPAHSLQISYPAPADRKPVVRAYQGDEDRQQYFLATIPAAENPVPNHAGDPADVLVLMDTSGSSGNLNRSRLAVRTIVNQLRPDDRVQLGCVDVDFRPLTEQWFAPGDEGLREVYQQLQQQVALGGSELNQSLHRAVAALMSAESPRRKIMIYIGDGIETVKSTTPFWKRIAERPDGKRPAVCLVRIGKKQGDTRWMQDAARATGGRFFDVESSPTGLDDLWEWSLAGLPIPRNQIQVQVDGMPDGETIIPAHWQPGRDLHVLGRRMPSPNLNLTLTVEGHPERKYELSVADPGKDDAVFTGRLWAQRKLETKLTERAQSPESLRDNLDLQIVNLCQEWSLMSPLTAFLVLETEDDYVRWNINRRLRQRYWSPPEALPFVPAPDTVKLSPQPIPERPQPVTRNTPRRRAEAVAWDRNFVTESLDQARKALEAGEVVTAHLHLARARERALQFEPEAFQTLYRQVSEKLERENSLQRLGIWRALADRHTPAFWSAPSPLVPLLVNGGIDPDYLARNPHAMKLAKTITVPKRSSLRDFAQAVQQQLGVPVLVAEQEILAEGGSVDQMVYTDGLEGISAYHMIKHVLDSMELDLVVDKHMFHITSFNRGQERMGTRIYPVGDLLRTDILPPPTRLSNPLLDREEFARRRIEARLQQPISVNFEDVHLRKALRQFSELVDLPLRIFEEEITGDGGSVDQRVNLQVADTPAGIVLREMLQPLELAHLVNRELLMITSETKAQERMDLRVYSAAGLVDGLTPDPVRNPFDPWMGGGMMGGMGGGFGGMGMGGGFGFGGMGGMGGGMGGMGMGGMGMGGMAGGFGVAGSVGSASGNGTTPLAAGLSEVEPYDGDDDGTQPISQQSPADAVNQPQWPNFSAGGIAPLGIGPAMRLIQSNTSGEWENEEGVGGRMSWFPNSLSLIVRQTFKVHREIAETFVTMRQMADRDPAHKIRRPRVRWTGVEDAVRNYRPLMNALTENTSGEWESEGGWGGTLTMHPASLSLVIRQTPNVHTEIEGLLARLRRARYVAETVPTRETLDGIDEEMFFFDHPVLTNLPRMETFAAIGPEEKKSALERLAVRKTPNGFNQRWRRTLKNSTVSELTVRRFENRLELETSDRVLRAEGKQAAVGYPRIGLVEVDAWGESIRQLTDGAFPWLPHRDNAELAELFEVSVAAETPESVSLRLTFRRSREMQIHATFARPTGQPTAWTVFYEKEPLLELKFAAREIVAVDAAGKELERWELISDEAAKPIPALAEFGPRWIVVEVADNRDPLTMAREALRQNEYAAAAEAFRRLKERNPDQPLVNFLFAWTLESSRRLNAADQAEQRAAIQRVLKSEAVDLIHWLNPAFFPTLGPDGLLDLLAEIPRGEQTAAICDQMAELALSSRRYAEALAAVTHAVELDSDASATSVRRLLQVEFLLRLHDAAAAQKVANAAKENGLSNSALCEFGDLFYRFEQPEIAALWYGQALASKTLSQEERSQLLARQALWLTGEARWEKLFEAHQTTPENGRTRDLYLGTLLQEVRHPAHAKLLIRWANEAKQPSARQMLLIRAAEVTDNPQSAADIVWDLFQERRLPVHRLPWMLSRLVDGGRGQDVIPLLETRLRRGEDLDRDTIRLLATAYRQQGRRIDAQRADSHHLDVTVPASSNNRGTPMGGGGGFF